MLSEYLWVRRSTNWAKLGPTGQCDLDHMISASFCVPLMVSPSLSWPLPLCLFLSATLWIGLERSHEKLISCVPLWRGHLSLSWPLPFQKRPREAHRLGFCTSDWLKLGQDEEEETKNSREEVERTDFSQICHISDVLKTEHWKVFISQCPINCLYLEQWTCICLYGRSRRSSFEIPAKWERSEKCEIECL